MESKKEQVVKRLIKWGNNPEEAKKMVDGNFETALKISETPTVSKLAEIIRIIAR